VRELTTIFTIGRAVISITDQRVLFEKICRGRPGVEADMGWLSCATKTHAIHLPRISGCEAWAKKMNQLDDGMGVWCRSPARPGHQREPLKQFKIAQIGKSAWWCPSRRRTVIGLLVYGAQGGPSLRSERQSLLEARRITRSISLVNAQLFRALAQTADVAQKGEKREYDRFETLRRDSRTGPDGAYSQLLLPGRWALTSDQRALNTLRVALEHMGVLTSRRRKPLRRP
jgi:hypothetical protein